MKLLLAADISVNYIENYNNEEILNNFKNVKPIFDNADFSVANLECVLYDGNSKPILKSGPNIKGDPRFIECLKYLNLDVAGLANNHLGDFGAEAAISTFNLLKENGISYIGAGENITEAYNFHIFEKDGLKVAIFAVCENEFGIADHNKTGSAGFNLSRVIDTMKNAKEKADKVIFYFHGGNEYNPFPSPNKVELYRLIADLGADAIIAMHTHCPQGYEIHNGKPIVYSMGNFFFPYVKKGEKINRNSSWYFGYLTQLHITKDNIELEVIPYRFGAIGEDIEILSGKEKDNFIKYLKEISEPITDIKRIKHLFNVWCAISGVVYAPALNFSTDMEKDGAEMCRGLKNALSCEAHNELLKTTLNLCYSNELDKYKQLTEEVTRYQNIKL